METPIQIDFQDFEAKPEVRGAIEKHVSLLEERFGRVTAGRVVLKGPGNRHRTGGLYDINIRLALPDGREVNIGRTPQNDERYSDLNFALNDAFKRARRQLQDQVRKLQGQVKQHDGEPTAIVSRIDPSGEFGFLETNDGREIYFHKNSVLGTQRMEEGMRVTFSEELGEKGPQASTVKLMGKHKLRA